ncbi:hypothetical protein [Thiolapillus brandeum]|uniref:Uncharacterized protein n=1 Tax=Thiolapillus brandeum TaxID=1076588 RepID=A0A7U6GJ09_9GAMM|nr:hypothetical protein [Thiolapillus brandeum]BAO44504.1 conserved hypothetical protein [Thiolapillus brandeum]
MKTFRNMLALIPLLMLALALPVHADGLSNKVDVQVISDDRGKLHEYPVDSWGRKQRSYIAVRDGERYRIRVRNRSGQRIGLVIAVDGRNIITGDKSWLGRKEAKYVLDPWESAEYEGWRTSRNQVNRFYFTDVEDSYADAWGDHSAMGVIAVAVYKQKEHEHYGYQQKRESSSRSKAARSEAMGTGFGERQWSPTHKVRFQPRKKPALKKFIKYERRRSLCRRGIIRHCGRDHDDGWNRFWPDDDDYDDSDEYAPYPWRLRHHRK